MRNLEHTKISYRDVLECKNELESIRAKLTDAKDVVETIESTIKEAWKGPSATSFYDKISKLKTDMTNESDSLTSLTLSIEESINSYQNVDMEIIKNKPSSNITSDNITSNDTVNQGSNGTINNNRNNTNNSSNNNSNNDSSNNTNNNQKYEESMIDDDGTIIIHIGSNDSITSKKPELKEGETVIQCGSAITRIIKNLHNDGSISDDVYNKYMTNVKGMYAKDYWTNNQNSNAFATSTEPKVGSIAVYNNGQYGHTALVTDVYYDKNGTGYVTVYESNIGNKNPEGGLSTMTIEEFKTRLGGKYQGCIDLMGNN